MQVDVDESFFNDPRARRAARLLGWHIDFLAGAMVRLWLHALHRIGPENPHGLVEPDDAEDATDHRGLVRACMTSKLAIEQADGRLYFAGTSERSHRLYHLRVNARSGGEARAKGAARIGGRFAPADTPAPPASDQPTAGETPASDQPELYSAPAPFPSGSLPVLSSPVRSSPEEPAAPVATEDRPLEQRPPELPQEPPRRQPALPALEDPPEVATGQPAALPAKKRPLAVADTEWHRAIAMFDQLFRAWSGQAPKWGGRERGQMKQLLEAGVTVEELAVRANVMFDMAGKFPAEHPDLGTLLANWDKFVTPLAASANGAPRVGQGRVATAEELGPSGDRRF